MPMLTTTGLCAGIFKLLAQKEPDEARAWLASNTLSEEANASAIGVLLHQELMNNPSSGLEMWEDLDADKGEGSFRVWLQAWLKRIMIRPRPGRRAWTAPRGKRPLTC